ncbi:MAG: ZmpA/ZmpB/ZmpC family metallo-endopeptidase-related protein, partial [Haloquadratum sp.]|nr:ZmpA/ZmpB/ZmpC family metallo-endopeptidase-related protein [Haloquadratum sp.]
MSYINISAPQNTTTQTVNITAIEGEDFAVSDGGTASITIEVGTSNPGLTIAPASARVVSATNASGGNATSAVSVSQTEYDLNISIDEQGENLSVGSDLSLSLQMDVTLSEGVTPTRSLQYQVINASGSTTTSDIVIGHTPTPMIDNLPRVMSNRSRLDLSMSGGGFANISLYARDDGEWNLLELDGQVSYSLGDDDRIDLADVALTEGEEPGNRVLDSAGRYQVAIVGYPQGRFTPRERTVGSFSDANATAFEVTITAPEETAGEGSAADPYIITDVRQLQAIAADLDAYYRLGNDIDAGETQSWSFNDGGSTGFTPIGPFTGVFEGGGHRIENLHISANHGGVGLFGSTDDAVIRNVTIADATVRGYDSVGILAGETQDTEIRNVSLSGEVQGWDRIGGLAASANGGRVANVTSSATVSGSDRVGGLIGWNTAEISSATATGSVSGAGDNIGGLVGGHGESIIRSSTATGDVSGEVSVGGLVGWAYGAVQNGSSSGNVEGETGVGGLVGYSVSEIHDSDATGAVAGRDGVGGLVGVLGYHDLMTPRGLITGPLVDMRLVNGSASGPVSGDTFLGGLVGVRGQYATTSTSSSSYTETPAGETVDTFGNAEQVDRWEARKVNNQDALSKMSGEGTQSTPYEVTDLDELQAMAADLDGHFRLAADVDASETRSMDIRDGGARGFVPIGDTHYPFTGSLDGNDHRISNLYINRTDRDGVGLFGEVTEATVTDLSITGADVSGGYRVGILAGSSEGMDTENIAISGNVRSSERYVGGVVGRFRDGRFQDASVDVRVRGRDLVGGAVGTANDALLSNLSIDGTVTGTDSPIGGATGVLGRNSRISGTTSHAAVIGGNATGGLVGTLTGV